MVSVATGGTGGFAIGPRELRNRINAHLLIRAVPDGLLECLWLFHG